MDNRKSTANICGPNLGFWFRLWQTQIDQSLKLWAIWASALPRPSAAELSAEAESLGDTASRTTGRKPAAKAGPASRKVPATASKPRQRAAPRATTLH